ncbi:MAG: lipopolysaccharide core heptose(I) kinase RfaP [Pseudohongiellaceae bacterium]
MTFLAEPFRTHWLSKKPLQELCKLEGEIYREVKSRKTFRFEFKGKFYFAKLHFGIGWQEIFKDIFQLRLPIVSAKNEWEAIAKLKQLNLETMNPVGFGSIGINPARVNSFIITEELSNTINLEDFCRDWKTQPPSFPVKLALIRKIAYISRTMHGAGMCHRDYYLCHFHLERASLNQSNVQLSLIDLHRALIKKNLSQRWLIKDIAGLHFSSMDIGLSARDKLRFMRLYSGQPLRKNLRDENGFWGNVSSRALKLYAKNKRAVKAAL